MRKSPIRVIRDSSVVLVLGALALSGAGCAAKSANSYNDAKGPSGTLSYQGFVTGSAAFPTADCTFDLNHHLLVFNAPHQDLDHPEIPTPGPSLWVTFLDSGAMVHFDTSENASDQERFMRIGKEDGVSYAKKGDNWTVTIAGFKIPNIDLMNQQWATLSGTLVCTHYINR
jgi:hypothetical protein